MFPNMDAIGLALARIYELIERLTIAVERIADNLDGSRVPADQSPSPDDASMARAMTDAE